MNRPTRRSVLRSTAATSPLLVAGCLGQPGGPNGPGDDDGPAVDDASIETTATDCGSPDDDDVAVETDDRTVTVEGVLPAPDPCHEAVLADAELDGSEVSLVVDVEDATDDDEDCIQCQGIVEYVATVELTEAVDLDAVHVEHVTGGSHAVGWDQATEGN